MSTTKLKHSALPWRIAYESGDTHVRDANGNSMACDMQYYPWTFDEDDAKFIVRAVNSHADMLEALERLSIAAETFASSDSDMPSHAETEREFESALESAKAAIAKAKGGAA